MGAGHGEISKTNESDCLCGGYSWGAGVEESGGDKITK